MHTYDVPVELKNGWKGKVTMEIPLSHQRMAVMAQVGAGRMMGSKDVKTKADKERSFEVNLPILAKAYDEARKLIRSVDLTGPGEKKCTTQDEMETLSDLDEVWILVASQYLEGFGPGKTKSQR